MSVEWVIKQHDLRLKKKKAAELAARQQQQLCFILAKSNFQKCLLCQTLLPNTGAIWSPTSPRVSEERGEVISFGQKLVVNDIYMQPKTTKPLQKA